MKQIFKDVRSLRKILHNKDFYFIITVYPIGAFLYVYALNLLRPNGMETQIIQEETKNLYSLWTTVGFMFFVLYSAYELIDKRLLYKNQGDKLKLKQGEKDWQKNDKKSK